MFNRFTTHGLAYGVAEYLTNDGKPHKVEFRPDDRRHPGKPFVIVPDDGEQLALIHEALKAIDSIELV